MSSKSCPHQYICLLVSTLLSLALRAQPAEFRGFWVDAFHEGFTTSARVTQLVEDARTANCNALVVQVRKRGDAFYGSTFEPRAAGVEPGFDPLADLIARGHDTAEGPRLEIHAWMNVYPVWRGDDGAPPPGHPLRLHPDWLTCEPRGDTYNSQNYVFDPGDPEVQKYLFNIAMDIVSRYAVDGLVLDYVGYAGKQWGYNTNVVKRFNRRFARTGQPKPDDPVWCQFRRDQVTALVRKIYLSSIALKPQLKISAATIAWPPAPALDAQWPSSAAYNQVLQDWRSWMEEGILDMNLPMIYCRQSSPRSASLFSQWLKFAREHRYHRPVVVAPAIYQNSISNAIVQVRTALEPSATGTRADGVCLYSHASYPAEKASRETFTAALTQPTQYDPNPVPVFAQAVPTPEMPWKTKATNGHLMGYVHGGRAANAAESAASAPAGQNSGDRLEARPTGLDGATITLSGPKARTLTSDATGFYGAVDLPPGTYTLACSFPGHHPATNTCTVSAGKVAGQDILLSPTTHPTLRNPHP